MIFGVKYLFSVDKYIKSRMATYRETNNYIWHTEQKLGTGATAVVYRGVNKNNGEPVAIKSFYRNYEPREIRVLQRIDHKNIVKLLGTEEVAITGDKVLIMEFCSGASLLKVLNEPENAYGVNDHEFLYILKNLYDGIKYLRDNNLIHRDLKPGKFF